MPGFDKIYACWIAFLNQAEPIIGIPLCAAGVVLVLCGWRMWKPVAVVNLALLGVGAGYALAVINKTPPDWRWMAGLALLLAIAGFLFARYTAPLLGGIAGGLVGYLLFSGLGFYGTILWISGAAALVAAIGWAYSYRQQVEAALASAEGGILFASGMAVMLPEVPILYRFFSSMTATSPFMIGFYVLVPTIVGIAMQQADMNRSLSKSVTEG